MAKPKPEPSPKRGLAKRPSAFTRLSIIGDKMRCDVENRLDEDSKRYHCSREEANHRFGRNVPTAPNGSRDKRKDR